MTRSGMEGTQLAVSLGWLDYSDFALVLACCKVPVFSKFELPLK